MKMKKSYSGKSGKVGGYKGEGGYAGKGGKQPNSKPMSHIAKPPGGAYQAGRKSPSTN